MERYKRNELIQGIGKEGQQKLSAAKVLVVGAGGLGSPVLYYLAAAGIGTLGIIDSDKVDESNLQRQIIHRTEDVNRLKVESAAEKIQALNPLVKVNTYAERFTLTNGKSILQEYDYVVDCCDNYAGKYLINDLCVEAEKPYTHGAVLAMRGEVMSYQPGYADYRSVFEKPPLEGTYQSSDTVGILGAVAGMVGCIQATEVIKYFTGAGCLILDRIVLIDARTLQFHSLRVSRK
ncbi:UBA/THIF-type NAD/FAD binding protein [Bacteroides coprosuis DSM 18011]|uniref:Molybdopterin-synthase adenylyltransferase n=1 Tax=Bacteroides coprosuis DSM 18011 TaxID=679937 RepID=F3ZQ62_9BACE|nr:MULTISPECIES: HesA/MoeB/ThiF family protein [Bacteroides]EGJ71728.1 UBA/THIF-type NAD/FAD binding protein [Bacteroides coprosuis DSM 18011]